MENNKIILLRRRMKGIQPLEDDEDFFTKDETLSRFLKARDWNLDEAEKLLKTTVEYRRKKKPLTLDCHWCHSRPGYHSMRQVGFDQSGRPVIYTSFCQTAIDKNTVEDAVHHFIYLMENAKRTMKPGVTTWIFIIDCSGMTLTACNPRIGYGVTQVMSNHYPERLGLAICFNHNPVFHGIWAAIKVFLHPNTVAKMKLVRTPDQLLKMFQKIFSEEMIEWLLKEIELNQLKPVPRSQMEFWNSPNIGHDPRGCPSYVKSYIEPYRVEMSSKGFVYLPHPNIVDSLKGCVSQKENPLENKEDTDKLSLEATGRLSLEATGRLSLEDTGRLSLEDTDKSSLDDKAAENESIDEKRDESLPETNISNTLLEHEQSVGKQLNSVDVNQDSV